VGTGPYKFVKWDRGSDIVLARNAGYWGTKGTFKTVTWYFRADSASRVSQVQAGEANIAWDVSSADAANLASGLKLTSHPDSIHVILKPDYVKGKLLSDPVLRQAIAMAIDNKSIIKGIFGGLADDPKGQLVNKGVVGFNPDLSNATFDPAKAKALVAQQGATGKTLTITTGPKWDKSKELAQAVEQMLDDIGFKVTVSYDDNAAWRAKYYAFNGGDFSSAPSQPDLAIGTTSNQSYTAISNLIAHVCDGSFPGGCDQEFTDTVKSASALPDLDARGAVYSKASAIMQTDAIAIPLITLRKNVITSAADGISVKITPGFCLYLDGVTVK
jgi:peptide/nickel transport system substrate-binding protein